MTICPKCRELAAEVAENNNSWPREGEEIAAEIRALPTHPQDAEVRDGLAQAICEADLHSPLEKAGTNHRRIADAILAYLHSQGWRRVEEGEVYTKSEVEALCAIAAAGGDYVARMFSASER